MDVEYPITFSDTLVRSIIHGQKTQTRRIAGVGPQPDLGKYRKPANQGNVLCVREAWDILTDKYGAPVDEQGVCCPEDSAPRFYRATDDIDRNWKSPFQMPRWAMRLWLQVTDVKLSRLQDLTESDARAEGVDSVASFRELWDSIRGIRTGKWDDNPWVWVTEFRSC